MNANLSSNGLGCSGVVFCFFAPLLLGTVEGDAARSRSRCLKREHNPVLRLLCNTDRARSTALETLLVELKVFPDTPCVPESVTFQFALELPLAKTCESSREHSPSESAKFQRLSSILLATNGGRSFADSRIF